MPALHQLLDFTPGDTAPTPPSSADLQTILTKTLGSQDQWMVTKQVADGGYVLLITRRDGCRVTFQYCKDGMAALDLFEPIPTQESPTLFSNEIIESLKTNVEEMLNSCSSSYVFPPLKRGFYPVPYVGTADASLQEIEITRVVCDVNSEYQNIKIFETLEYGNVLVLDNDVNIAESDHVYTETITGSGREDFNGKTVLILGGGDGGVLREVLRHSPKFVTMVEIDEAVVDLCRKHLRGVCGDVLDSVTGDNYEIKIGDCIPIIRSYIDRGLLFDYIISDLTDVPICPEPIGSSWDLIRLVLNLSVQILLPSGRLYAQVKGLCAKKALSMYEQQLQKLSCPVDFSWESVCVPSYHEYWVFYKIWKK